MQQRTKTIFTWIGILGLASLSIVLRMFSSQIVEHLYQIAPGMLNQILDVPSDASFSLNYYIGRMEDVILGPVSVLAVGLSFLIFSLSYLQKANSKIFGVAVFIYLLIAKFEILFFPPYGDAVGGPFVEAVWLSRHSFDYLGLMKQPDYIHGGPRVYLFSLYPGYLALLMKLIPNTKLFLLINHLIVFALGAATISLFRGILKKVFNTRISLLVAVLFLSLPLFQSQVEAINMEVPVLFFSVLAIHQLIKRNVLTASLMAIVGAMIKGYAILICGTVFFGSLVLFLWGGAYRFKVKPLLWGILSAAFVFLQSWLSLHFFSEEGQVDMVGMFSGWPSIKVIKISHIYLASVGIILFVMLIRFVVSKLTCRDDTADRRSFFDRYFPEIIMFVSAAAWFALFINSFAVSPRYRLLAYPFIVFCAFFSFSQIVRHDLTRRWGLVAAIVLACLSSYGYPQQAVSNKNHVILERSLEYRNDLKVNMRAARVVEEKFSEFLIGAPFIYAQFLALPELGYVDKQLDVMIYGMPCTYGNIKNFNGLSELNIFRTLWVGIDEGDFEYPVNPNDKVLETVAQGDREVFLFLGGKSIELRRLAIGLYGYMNSLK